MKISRTAYFQRREEKYLKKLNPKQKITYQGRLAQFEAGYPDPSVIGNLKVHPLTGDKNGKYAFTCLKDKDRNDRVIFQHVGDVLEMEEIDISMEDVGTHDEVYG